MHRCLLPALTVTLLAAAPPAGAQPYGASPFEEEAFRTVSPRRKGPEPPPVELRPAEEIPIPGPVRGRDLETVGPEVRVRVGDGLAIIRPDREAGDVRVQPVIEIEPDGDPLWVRGGRKGRLRFRTLPEGVILAEKRSPLTGNRWRKVWKLRIAGSTPFPPLAVRERLFVGSTDSRIYALRARNGHRLWARDVGERLDRPLAHWNGKLGESRFDLLLAIPADGKQILAIDPFDGRTLASYRVPGSGDSLATRPAVLEDGRVAVAVQKYDEKAASLLLLELRPTGTGPKTEEMPYNEGGIDAEDAPRREGGKARR